jgi:tRNA threonylcarbamoyl adenosine modification protein YjeE
MHTQTTAMTYPFATPCERTCSSERELAELAAELAVHLRPGDVVALSGALGSGKTAFARAIVESMHGQDEGRSPTFTFRHRHDGNPPIEHLDFYRIDNPRELVELGLEDAFGPDAIVLVEWWQNAPQLLPSRRWEIEIEGAGSEPRRVRLTPPR